MRFEVKNITPSELLCEELATMCKDEPPHMVLAAENWMQSGSTELLVDREEVAWWLTVRDGNVVEIRGRHYSLRKMKRGEDGKWVLAGMGEDPDHWFVTREEDPVFGDEDAFEAYLQAWLADASIGFSVDLMMLYPWPGKS